MEIAGGTGSEASGGHGSSLVSGVLGTEAVIRVRPRPNRCRRCKLHFPHRVAKTPAQHNFPVWVSLQTGCGIHEMQCCCCCGCRKRLHRDKRHLRIDIKAIQNTAGWAAGPVKDDVIACATTYLKSEGYNSGPEAWGSGGDSPVDHVAMTSWKSIATLLTDARIAGMKALATSLYQRSARPAPGSSAGVGRSSPLRTAQSGRRSCGSTVQNSRWRRRP